MKRHFHIPRKKKEKPKKPGPDRDELEKRERTLIRRLEAAGEPDDDIVADIDELEAAQR